MSITEVKDKSQWVAPVANQLSVILIENLGQSDTTDYTTMTLSCLNYVLLIIKNVNKYFTDCAFFV